MNYHLKSRPRINKKRRFMWFFLFFVIIFTFVLPSFFFIIGVTFAKTGSGFINNINEGVKVVSSYFTSHSKLALENERLKNIENEVNDYKQRNKILLEEIKSLKNIRNSNKEATIANVIALPPQTPYSMITIESDQTVKEGSLVLSTGGVLIGKVNDVVAEYARVDLLSRAGFSYTVENMRTGERIEVEGHGAGNFRSELPKDIDIQNEDILIKRTATGIYPVAVVRELEIRESSPILTAYSISPTSIFSLSRVLIIDSQYEIIEE